MLVEIWFYRATNWVLEKLCTILGIAPAMKDKTFYSHPFIVALFEVEQDSRMSSIDSMPLYTDYPSRCKIASNPSPPITEYLIHLISFIQIVTIPTNGTNLCTCQ